MNTADAIASFEHISVQERIVGDVRWVALYRKKAELDWKLGLTAILGTEDAASWMAPNPSMNSRRTLRCCTIRSRRSP